MIIVCYLHSHAPVSPCHKPLCRVKSRRSITFPFLFFPLQVVLPLFELNSDIPGNSAIKNTAEEDTSKLSNLYSCPTAGSTVIISDRYFHKLFFTMKHALAIYITVNGEFLFTKNKICSIRRTVLNSMQGSQRYTRIHSKCIYQFNCWWKG